MKWAQGKERIWITINLVDNENTAVDVTEDGRSIWIKWRLYYDGDV